MYSSNKLQYLTSNGYLSENRGPCSFIHPSVTPDRVAPIEEFCVAGGIVIRGIGGITVLLRYVVDMRVAEAAAWNFGRFLLLEWYGVAQPLRLEGSPRFLAFRDATSATKKDPIHFSDQLLYNLVFGRYSVRIVVRLLILVVLLSSPVGQYSYI
jgi:hypothetical protein